MKENQPLDPIPSALEQELNRMAEEVPEMPESFRQGWRNAIRQGAAGASAAENILPLTQHPQPVSESLALSAGTDDPSEKPAPSAPVPKKHISASWRRGLSIAAVFLFLLGGTLLGQDTVSLTRKGSAPSVSAAVPPPLSTAAPVPTTAPTDTPKAFSAAAPDSSSDMAALPDESLSLLTGSSSPSDASAAREAGEAKSAGEELLFEAEESVAMNFMAEAPETEEAEAAESTEEIRDAGSAAESRITEAVPESEVLSGSTATEETTSPPAWPRALGIALVCLSFALAALLLILKNRP